MTDQTQTTTEPVAWVLMRNDFPHSVFTDKAEVLAQVAKRKEAEKEAAREFGLTSVHWSAYDVPLRTTPQPLAIGLGRSRIDRIRARLQKRSPGDEAYEKPMSWDDADYLVSILALAAPAEGWKPGDRVRLATGGCATICNVRYGVAMDLDSGEPDLGWAPQNFLETDETDFIERLPAAPTGETGA